MIFKKLRSIKNHKEMLSHGWMCLGFCFKFQVNLSYLKQMSLEDIFSMLSSNIL